MFRGKRAQIIAAVRQLSARYALRKQPVAGTHTNAETRLLSAHYRPLLTHYWPIIDHYKPCWTAAMKIVRDCASLNFPWNPLETGDWLTTADRFSEAKPFEYEDTYLRFGQRGGLMKVSARRFTQFGRINLKPRILILLSWFFEEFLTDLQNFHFGWS